MKKALTALVLALVLLALCEPHVRESIARSISGLGREENETQLLRGRVESLVGNLKIPQAMWGRLVFNGK